MAIYNNSFEGLANNTAVTTGNSGGASGTAFDAVFGSVMAQTSAAHIGSRGLTATLTSSTESYVAWNVSGTDHYVRGYFRVPSGGPTHNMRLIYGHTGGTKNWEVRINIPSQHVDLLTNGSQRINLGAAPVTNGNWYRIEARIHAGGAELRLYNTSNTLLDSGTWSGAPTTGTQVRYGLHNGAAISSAIDGDGFGYSDTGWLGAYPVGSGNLENSFEGLANNTAVTTGNSGGASGTAFDAVFGSVMAQTSAAHIGSRGLTATLTSSTESYVAWNVSGTDHYVRGYFRVPSGGPTHNMRLIYGHTGGTKNWEVRINIPSQHVDLLTNGSQRINLGAAPVTNGNWYRIEARIHAGGAELRLYNTSNTLLDSGTWSGAPTTGTQVRYGLHNGAAISSAIDGDGFGYSDTGWLGAATASNQAPAITLSASPNPIRSYQTVTLTMNASDPDGPPPALSVVQIAGSPTVTLSGTGSTRTFEAPALQAGTALTFEATADDGELTATDTTIVTVYPHNEFLRSGGLWVPRRKRNRQGGSWV